jgi:hypothetical protein
VETIADVLVPTDNFYAAILDESSPTNTPGFDDRAWQDAGELQRRHGGEKYERLFHYNGLLSSSAKRGEMFPWLLLIDGVFRAIVLLDPNPTMPLPPIPDRRGMPEACDLRCPSGRLMVCCTSWIGRPGLSIAARVPPGTYRASIEQDEDESDHWFLQSADEYPPGDGPDWKITLRKISAEATFEAP